jgi:hypothetical protein
MAFLCVGTVIQLQFHWGIWVYPDGQGVLTPHWDHGKNPKPQNIAYKYFKYL